MVKLAFILGLICILCNSAATVVFTLVIQLLGSSSSLDQPFLEVFWNHVVWVLIFPIAWLWLVVFEKKHGWRDLPWKRLVIWGFTGGPLLVFGAFSYYLSLTRTSLVVSNSVNNCVFVPIFILAVVFLKETLSIARVAGMLVSVGGVVMLAFGSDNGTNEGVPDISVLGFVFLLIALVFGAVYSILFSWLFREENVKFGNSPIISLFAIAFIGLSTLTVMWAGVVIGHYSGLEPFVMPTLSQFEVLLFNALMDLILNLANLLAILFIGAALNAVGLLLTVPLAVVTQALYLHSELSGLAYGGIVLILLGCVVFYVGDLVISKVRKRNEDKKMATEEKKTIEEEEEEKKLIQ
jgi:drug/metabolite transporter (DMT)-like permease